MSQPAVKRRITRACDFCNRRGLKCAPSETSLATGKCGSCERHAVHCTYDRPTKKRGPPPRALSPTSSTTSGRDQAATTAAAASSAKTSRQPSPASPWRPSALVPVFALLRALETYYEAVYPIFPFFVWPAFIKRVQYEDHLNNRSFYGTVMAAAALGAARLRDNAAGTTPLSAEEAAALPSPEALFAAAEDAIPKNFGSAADFDLVRSTALLAVCAIQLASPKKMYQHVGGFWTLCSMHRLHDEKNWSVTSRVEVEERRRVLWSMYTLELFACLSFGGVQRTREAALQVHFPSEIDDDFLANGAEQPARSISWLHGWNFTCASSAIIPPGAVHKYSRPAETLEHAMDANYPRTVAGASSQVSSPALLDFLDTTYATLPLAFKHIQPYSGLPDRDRFGYQAANILVTLQTVRMVVVCRSVEDVRQREEAVRVAEDTLRQVSAIPIAYSQGISSPLIHHLVGIYKLLFPVTERALTPDLFVRVRQLLIDMTTLVGRLQSRLTYTIDVNQRFMSQIQRMDEAQATAFSRPTSPHLPPCDPPAESLVHAQVADAAALGFSGSPSELHKDPPWEAAFELQDIFSDWPFDFLSSGGPGGFAPDAAQAGAEGSVHDMPGEASTSTQQWAW
ncbi:hypothetical protein JCM3770_006170 [Rhodotorula araucariae]